MISVGREAREIIRTELSQYESYLQKVVLSPKRHHMD